MSEPLQLVNSKFENYKNIEDKFFFLIFYSIQSPVPEAIEEQESTNTAATYELLGPENKDDIQFLTSFSGFQRMEESKISISVTLVIL